MPTVLRQDGFEIMIYTHDHEPMHVHVFTGEAEVIILLTDLSVRKTYEMSGRDARKAQEIIAVRRDFLMAEWLRIGPVTRTIDGGTVVQYTPITDAELAKIDQETYASEQTEPRLTEARYDDATGELTLTLRDNISIRFPARQLKSLQDARDAQLADLRIVSRGSALFFDSLDVQMTTIALLRLVFKMPSPADRGRLGGGVRSAAKTAAARANGSKGGRPRQVAA